MNTLSVLDLQGLEATHEYGGIKGGGSNLTVSTCESKSPSNVSLILCH